jgi:hypothetical protein
MKTTRNSVKRTFSSMMIPVLALLAAVGAGRANVVIGTFNSAADVSVYSFQGWNGSSDGVAAFSTNAPTGGLSSGSMQLQLTFDNPGEQGGSFLSSAASVDVSEATNLEFDVMVDPASPVDPNGNVFYFQIGFNSPSYDNINPFWLGSYGKNFTPGVWQHIEIAIPPGSLGSSESQFFIYPYDNSYATSETPIIYVDNIVFDTLAANAPGPKVSLAKPTPGLNVFASTTGIYDRESARLTQNTGKSWVSHATTSNPVTYSFTLDGFPNVPAYSTEAYLFLVPNPVANDNAPDYNEADCVIAEVQSSGSGSLLSLQYKVNEADGNGMFYDVAPYTNAPGSWNGVTTPWYESGILGNVSSTVLNGTYTLEFTSSSNLTLIVPDGSSTNLVIPPYNATDFAETSGFNIYLGMQANTSAAFGQAVAYSSFSVSNTASPFSDNFLADTTLNTNNWDTSVASGPAGVLVVPATAADWITWTAPAAGYSLETGSNLLDLAHWTSPTHYPVISFSGGFQQLVDKTELPAGGIGFFNLIHRTATQLQVLLPGETNAPGTALGYTGSPTPISLAAQGLTPTTITVNACDSQWNIVNKTDSITISTTDGGAFTSNASVSMVNGTAIFSGSNGILFSDDGSWTVSATDLSTATIPIGTSAPVTVGP